MKKTLKMAALALMVSFAAISCKKKVTDADLTTKAATAVVAYPGISVEVKEGQAHISGIFATQAEKDAAIADLKKVEGIKDVHDMASVAAPAVPVEVNTVDPAILQKVNDAVKDIKTVKAENVNGILTLTGTASSTDARKVKESVDALKIGKYDNKIIVK